MIFLCHANLITCPNFLHRCFLHFWEILNTPSDYIHSFSASNMKFESKRALQIRRRRVATQHNANSDTKFQSQTSDKPSQGRNQTWKNFSPMRTCFQKVSWLQRQSAARLCKSNIQGASFRTKKRPSVNMERKLVRITLYHFSISSCRVTNVNW